MERRCVKFVGKKSVKESCGKREPMGAYDLNRSGIGRDVKKRIGSRKIRNCHIRTVTLGGRQYNTIGMNTRIETETWMVDYIQKQIQ